MEVSASPWPFLFFGDPLTDPRPGFNMGGALVKGDKGKVVAGTPEAVGPPIGPKTLYGGRRPGL